MQGAAALGASATAISSALRVAPTRAQDAGEVTFWTTYTANDLANVQAVVDGYNAQATGAKVKLVQIPPAQVTDTTTLMTAVRGGTGPDLYLFDRFIVAQRAGDGLLQDLSALGADRPDGQLRPVCRGRVAATTARSTACRSTPTCAPSTTTRACCGGAMPTSSIRPTARRPGTRSPRSPTSSMSRTATATTRRWASCRG